MSDYKLPEYDAGVLTQSKAIADYFEKVAAGSGNASKASAISEKERRIMCGTSVMRALMQDRGA